MITDGWAETLRCSRCGARYEVTTDALRCPSCRTTFPIDAGIPVLHDDQTIGTHLEEIDYDEVHRINDSLIDKTGAQWSELFDRFGMARDDVLEIGTGTGALTLGLLRHQAVGRLTATDVSHKFLSMLAPRLEPFPTPVSMVACDANVPHFAEQSFDIVVGRSILHHLLDYDLTLEQCCKMLKPGGAAVFFEPVLEGKIIVAMLMSLVLRADAAAAKPRLTDEDRTRMRATIGHQMKSTKYPQDRESLSKLEDKYIFHIDKMKQAGLDAGFDAAEFVNNGEQDPSYWANVVRISKVPAARIEPYRWVGNVFANTYGKIFPERLSTPMGFFVFRKAARPGAAVPPPAEPLAAQPLASGSQPAKSPPPKPRASVPNAPAAAAPASPAPAPATTAPAPPASGLRTRAVVALTRAGLSVRGSRELLVANGGKRERALVFVVSDGDGGRFLVAANAKARWVGLLRSARRAELRLGRSSEQFRASEVNGELRREVVRNWQARVGGKGAGGGAPAPEPAVFRVDAP